MYYGKLEETRQHLSTICVGIVYDKVATSVEKMMSTTTTWNGSKIKKYVCPVSATFCHKYRNYAGIMVLCCNNCHASRHCFCTILEGFTTRETGKVKSIYKN